MWAMPGQLAGRVVAPRPGQRRRQARGESVRARRELRLAVRKPSAAAGIASDDASLTRRGPAQQKAGTIAVASWRRWRILVLETVSSSSMWGGMWTTSNPYALRSPAAGRRRLPVRRRTGGRGRPRRWCSRRPSTSTSRTKSVGLSRAKSRSKGWTTRWSRPAASASCARCRGSEATAARCRPRTGLGGGGGRR